VKTGVKTFEVADCDIKMPSGRFKIRVWQSARPLLYWLSMHRPRILVVDDNRDALDFFILYLTKRGFRVAWAYDGLTGLALAKVTKPDLILLNWQMPHMDGLAVLKELRGNPETSGLKVIMTSGHVFVREWAAEAGAQDAILYPPTAQEIGEKVDRVLRQQR
jgi:two-component system phosphate regulon response regulator PhoB